MVPVFPGFSEDVERPLMLPDEFFGRLLPQMHHALELKLVLLVCAMLAKQQGPRRCVSLRELHSRDEVLHSMRSEGNPRAPHDNLNDAVERAVSRGVFLTARVQVDGDEDRWLFLNSPSGRRAVEGLQLAPGGSSRQAALVVAVTVEEPTLFALYEQNIGLLTPIIAELIRDAAADYPEAWVREAISLAAAYNRRSWRYVQRILDRWSREGRDHGTADKVPQRRPATAKELGHNYNRYVRS